jgi:hypothetical protein
LRPVGGDVDSRGVRRLAVSGRDRLRDRLCRRNGWCGRRTDASGLVLDLGICTGRAARGLPSPERDQEPLVAVCREQVDRLPSVKPLRHIAGFETDRYQEDRTLGLSLGCVEGFPDFILDVAAFGD